MYHLNNLKDRLKLNFYFNYSNIPTYRLEHYKLHSDVILVEFSHD